MIPDTEQGRIARIVASTDVCMRSAAVAKARLFYTPSCKGCVYIPQTGSRTVPLSSTFLEKKMAACKPIVGNGCGLQSTRIAAIQQCVLDNAINPLNPEARFSEFRGPFVAPVCPPIPQEYLNANVPKNQLRSCPLPNKPDNLVLPG